MLKGQGKVKKWLSTLLRFARRWHTPAAIIAIAFIILHTVAVFMYGFKFDFNNIREFRSGERGLLWQLY